MAGVDGDCSLRHHLRYDGEGLLEEEAILFKQLGELLGRDRTAEIVPLALVTLVSL
jgi:hypothetical protein